MAHSKERTVQRDPNNEGMLFIEWDGDGCRWVERLVEDQEAKNCFLVQVIRKRSSIYQRGSVVGE